MAKPLEYNDGPDDVLPAVLEALKESRALTGSILLRLDTLYQNRFWKALKTVTEKRVNRYVFQPSGRIRWIVVGKERDYLLLPDHYCSCQDFYIKGVIQRQIRFCYHLLAKILAEALNVFSNIELEDSKYSMLMQDWKLITHPAGEEDFDNGI